MMQFLYRLSDSLRRHAQRRLLSPEQASGRMGEDLAHRFLRRQGFTVVARNFRPRSGAGEIDLIAWDGDTLVIVEVKSRRSEEFGSPERNIDRDKERSLIRAAGEYARRASVEWERVRFDVVTVVFGDPPRIAHLKNAFPPR